MNQQESAAVTERNSPVVERIKELKADQRAMPIRNGYSGQ
jgi:hypothetical protein